MLFKSLLALGLVAAAAAVRVHSGASYHPTIQQHQLLSSLRAKGQSLESTPAPADVAAAPYTPKGMALGAGPLLPRANIYLIWYGSWSESQKTTIRNLAKNMGSSTWWTITKVFYDHNGAYLGVPSFAGEASDNYSQGKSISSVDQFKSIISKALTGGLSGGKTDDNGVYFVLTAPDVTEGNTIQDGATFCGTYCGYHYDMEISGKRIYWSFVGNPSSQCPTGCAYNGNTVTGDLGIDAISSIFSHELTEAVTDPYNNEAWMSTSGTGENADMCAWTFGTVQGTAPNTWNTVVGGQKFLIQQNFNPKIGKCALTA